MNFLKLSTRNIFRHKTRSFLSMVAIACSVAVFFSILSLSKGFEKGVKREREKVGVDFVVAPGSCPHELASLLFYGSVPASYLDESLAREIRKTKGLTFASPMLILNVPTQKKEEKVLLYGYEMPLIKQIKPEWEIQGEIPEGWDAIAANKVLVGWEFARKYGFKVGDLIQFPSLGRIFQISGIIRKTYSKDDAFIYAPLVIAQQIAIKISGKAITDIEDVTCSSRDKITPDPISAVAVKVIDPAQISPISAELENKIPGIQIVTVSQATDSISSLVASVEVLGMSVSIIAFIVAAAGVMNSILMTIFELTSELGMMRATGASRSDIFKLVLLSTMTLTGIGGVAGIVLTVLAGSVIEMVIRNVVAYVPSSQLIVFDPVIAGWCIVVSILLGACAGMFPAWLASRVDPMEAIRNN